VTEVHRTIVVPSPTGVSLAHFAAGHPTVAGEGGQVRSDGPDGDTRLDHGVPARPKGAEELPAESWVPPACFDRVEELELAHAGRGRLSGPPGDIQLGPCPRDGERSARTKAQSRNIGGELRPKFSSPQGCGELISVRPTAHPDQPEVAHARAPGLGL